TINRARDQSWRQKLWRALADAGLTLAWVPEKQGGAGGSLTDGFAILGVAGRYALSVPLAETLLAGWLLARTGISSPAGPMTVAPARPRDKIALNKDGTLSGVSRGVAFAKDCEHVAVIATGDKGANVALVKTGDCSVAEGKNLAGDDSDRVTFDGVRPLDSAPVPFDVSALMLMGATMRSVQAADTIVHSDTFDDTVLLEAASAKVRTGEAAAEGAAIAHQVHGAIGFTNEHVLHRFTLRLLSWRDDFGSESYWAAA